MADVPNFPGVPQLLTGFAAASSINLLSGNTVTGWGTSLSPSWGVYQDGQSVIDFDSFLGIDYRQNWAIGDYPLEEGQFASYNKVNTPFDVRVRFASGLNDENRQAMLASVAQIAGDHQLYDVVTPEVVYQSVNVQRYDYRRESKNGVGLLVIELWLLEIRQVGVASPANTQSPSGVPTISGGTVAPQVATNYQTSLLSTGVT